MCVSVGKKCQFLRKFCVRTKWMIPMVVLENLTKFTRMHLQCSLIFSNFTKYKTTLLVCPCEFCETFTTAFLKTTSRQLLLKYQIGLILSLLIAISLINGVNVASYFEVWECRTHYSERETLTYLSCYQICMSLREKLVQKYVRLLSSVKVKLKISRISSTYRLKVVTGSGYYLG